MINRKYVFINLLKYLGKKKMSFIWDNEFKNLAKYNPIFFKQGGLVYSYNNSAKHIYNKIPENIILKAKYYFIKITIPLYYPLNFPKYELIFSPELEMVLNSGKKLLSGLELPIECIEIIYDKLLDSITKNTLYEVMTLPNYLSSCCDKDQFREYEKYKHLNLNYKISNYINNFLDLCSKYNIKKHYINDWNIDKYSTNTNILDYF